MEPRWLLSAWLSSCRTSASACSRCAALSTCRLASSSLRCPSSAATNNPSTVASSSATSVIWRAAAEFTLDDRSMSLKLNGNRYRDTKSRAISIEFQGHRSEEHTSELQSRVDLVCRLLLEKKKNKKI